MRRALLAVLLLGLSAQGWGATYYVNTSTGSDGNTGLSAVAAWKHPAYAVKATTANDTVNIVTPTGYPDRYGIKTTAIMTLQGTSAATKADITTLRNVSHGATIGNILVNGDMEGWLADGSQWYGSPAVGNGVSKEDTIVQDGLHSAKLIRSGSDVRYWTNGVYLPASAVVTLSYAHYETGADTIRFRLNVKDNTSTAWLHPADNTWSTNADIDPGAGAHSTNAWAIQTLKFPTNATGIYIISVWLQSNTTSYLDNVSLTIDAGTYSWAAVGGKSYYKLNIKMPRTISTMAKSSASAWTTSGVAGLSLVNKAASLAGCDNTLGTWWCDSTNYDLYYSPLVGEDITALHMEVTEPRIDDLTAAGAPFDATHSVTAKYLSSWFGYPYGFYIRATDNAFVGVGLDAHDTNGTPNFYITKTASLTDCSSEYGDDGYLVAGTGVTGTLLRCRARYAGDDGFQSFNAAKLICSECIASDGGLQQDYDNSGFSEEGANSAMELYNCVSHNNYGAGIEIRGTGASVVKNTVAWGNATAAGLAQAGIKNVIVLPDNVAPTANHNLYGSSENWPTDATDKTTDPLFTDASDYRPLPTSPLIGAGVGVGLATDYAGNLVRNPPSIGAYEDTSPLSTADPADGNVMLFGFGGR